MSSASVRRSPRSRVNPYEIFLSDWKIVGSFAIRKNFSQSINMLSGKKIQTDKLVSLRYPIERFPELLELKMTRLDLMKVQIQFPSATGA